MWVSSNGQNKIKLEEEANSKVLVADRLRESGVELAIWKTIFRRKKKKNSSSSKSQQKSPQQTLASEITNPSALPSAFFSQPKKGNTVCQM